MWFKHPKYKFAREQFRSEVSPSSLSYLHYSLPKILFICGGDEEHHKNRSKIEKYIKNHHPLFLTFRAEYAWDVISKKAAQDKSVNALSLEEWLADFSDIVVILVESFGTVAELGAFSLSPPLRKKLLPVLDNEYKNTPSFINTGPVTWVNNESKYAPSIYTDFSTILTCMPELEERLHRKHHALVSGENKYGRYRFSKKVLLFFVLYVVSSLGPISIKEIVGILNDVIGYKDKQIISFILSIGVALELFNELSLGDDSYFTCFDYDKFFRHESTHSLLQNIQRSRARSLASLMRIPEFKEMLAEVVNNAA